METRYTGEPTLDEPVSKTIVRYDGQRGLMVDARFDFYLSETAAGVVST
jgi:hypothetical protein